MIVSLWKKFLTLFSTFFYENVRVNAVISSVFLENSALHSGDVPAQQPGQFTPCTSLVDLRGGLDVAGKAKISVSDGYSPGIQARV